MVSVIIPIYNLENVLNRCIDSIVDQTYRDIELILVDDGSKDSSGNICDVYSQKDDRIKVLHQPNGGISSARNAGLKCAKGDYIMFVDGDDYVHPQYIESFVNNMEVEPFDIVIGGIESFPFGNIVKPADASYYESDMNRFVSNHVTELYCSMINSKLYKHSIIKQQRILFDINALFAEDWLFNLDYLKWCNSAKVISKSYYYYADGSQLTTDKYAMSAKALHYLLNEFENRFKYFDHKYSIQINRLPLRHIVSCYRLEDIYIQKSDDEYYNLYNKFVRITTKNDFYSDNFCSPIKRTLYRIANNYKEHHDSSGRMLMSEMQLLYNDIKDIGQMHPFFWLLFKLITKGQFFFAEKILHMFVIYKKICSNVKC